MTGEIKLRFDKFFVALVEKIKVDNETRFPSGLVTVDMEYDMGRKYIRLVRVSCGQRSAYGFINTVNGDILKAASWKAPAKTARGNIFSEDMGLSCCESHGISYLK